MLRTVSLAIALVGFALARPIGAAPEGPVPEALFAYDATKPLDVKEKRVITRDGIEEHDISFAGPKDGRVTAFLLVPEGQGPFAAIVLLHGATGSRRSLLPGARLFCKAGAVCLLPDAPFCGDRKEMGKGLMDITKPEQMRDGIVQEVIELRAGLDLLLARPDVDPKRVGFIGSSIGGSVGGILSGVDKRVAAYALVAAAGSWEDAALKSNHPAVRLLRSMMSKSAIAKATGLLSPLDPIRYVSKAAPAAVLFQAGRKDTTTPVECAQAYMDAATEPKTCKWYEADHGLDIQAFKERAEWLKEKIGIGAVAEPADLRGLNH